LRDLLLGAFAVPPLLRHPVGGDTLRHGLENENETAGATPFAIGEVLLLATDLDALQRMSDRGVG